MYCDLERYPEIQLYYPRPLRPSRFQKICIVSVDELRAETEHRIIEEVEHVNSRSNLDALAAREGSGSAHVDRARAWTPTIIARQVSA